MKEWSKNKLLFLFEFSVVQKIYLGNANFLRNLVFYHEFCFYISSLYRCVRNKFLNDLVEAALFFSACSMLELDHSFSHGGLNGSVLLYYQVVKGCQEIRVNFLFFSFVGEHLFAYTKNRSFCGHTSIQDILMKPDLNR